MSSLYIDPLSGNITFNFFKSLTDLQQNRLGRTCLAWQVARWNDFNQFGKNIPSLKLT